MRPDFSGYQIDDMALQRITYEEAGSNLVMVVSAPVAGWRSKAKLPPAIRNFLGMNLFFEETLKSAFKVHQALLQTFRLGFLEPTRSIHLLNEY